jgi:hypothetical protein
LAAGAKNPLRLAAIVLSDRTTRGHLVGKQLGETLMALLLPATKAASAAERPLAGRRRAGGLSG